ncbi:MAG: hypothetical protein R2824_03090 [Saprospiraceae bacterium]
MKKEKTLTLIAFYSGYEYDSKNRIILKETYYGDDEEKELGSIEITIYD